MNCCLDASERFDPVHLEQAVESCQQDKGLRMEVGVEGEGQGEEEGGSWGRRQRPERGIPVAPEHTRVCAREYTGSGEREITNYGG